MTFTDQGKIVRFIKDAKEHRQWLFDEFSDLDARSDDYESNQRAIRGAIGELDKIIGNAIQMRGHRRFLPNGSHY